MDDRPEKSPVRMFERKLLGDCLKIERGLPKENGRFVWDLPGNLEE